jgi:hypothetical protein
VGEVKTAKPPSALLKESEKKKGKMGKKEREMS